MFLIICSPIGAEPKGSGSGVLGDRFEHYRELATVAGQGSATATVLTRLVGGHVPSEALDVILAGKLLGLAEKDDGTRVLACGAAARRMVARAVCAVRRDKKNQGYRGYAVRRRNTRRS